MKLSFSLLCTPPRVTKQMKKTIPRGRHVIHVDTPELKEAQALYMGLLLPHRPQTPLVGPLRLSVFWHFAHLESAPKRRAENLCWKDTSPDLDNCEKLLIDTMQKMGFFANDGQIALKQTAKVYDPKIEGLVIELEELPEFAQ